MGVNESFPEGRMIEMGDFSAEKISAEAGDCMGLGFNNSDYNGDFPLVPMEDIFN